MFRFIKDLKSWVFFKRDSITEDKRLPFSESISNLPFLCVVCRKDYNPAESEYIANSLDFRCNKCKGKLDV